MLLPALRHLDVLRLLAFVSRSVAELLGVGHDLRDEVRQLCVQDVEHVFAVGLPTLRDVVGEVLHQVRVPLDLWVDALDADLVVLRHDHDLELLEGHEEFALREDVLQEVLVDHGVWRHVELDCNGG